MAVACMRASDEKVSGIMPISLDDESTWPPAVLKHLEANVGELAVAQVEFVSAIDELIGDQEIIGYHCTRLTQDEVARVKAQGLCPLTEEMRQSRVQRRVEAGNISPEMGARLLQLGLGGNGRHRLGYSCFFFTKEIGEWCWKFFRYWGGESIYVPHMSTDSEERNTLRAIGAPCIIEIAVPVSAIPHKSVAQGFLYEYGRRRDIQIREASHDVARVPMRVLRVIEYGSSDFTRRTKDIPWPNTIHP
jgi:hypothetical protein